MRLLPSLIAAVAAILSVLLVIGCGKEPPPPPPAPTPTATAPDGSVDEAADDPTVFADDPKRMRRLGHQGSTPAGQDGL